MPTTAKKKAAAKKQAAGAGKPRRFRVRLEKADSMDATRVVVPFEVEKVFGTRARVPVRGTINGTPYRGSLFPMGGRHFMVVNRRLRAAAGLSGGETVTVTMERDTEPRVVTPPADFARALGENSGARAAWDQLSYTHQREYAEHVEEAKRPETRRRRIEKSVELLAAGKKEPR